MQSYKENLFYSNICRNLTLTLTHFELRVLLVDYEQTTLTTYDLAVS